MLASIVCFNEKYCSCWVSWKNNNDYLIASVLQETNLDPTIINGGVINSIKSSAKLGKVIGQF